MAKTATALFIVQITRESNKLSQWGELIYTVSQWQWGRGLAAVLTDSQKLQAG